jgi:hypothetical protein
VIARKRSFLSANRQDEHYAALAVKLINKNDVLTVAQESDMNMIKRFGRFIYLSVSLLAAITFSAGAEQMKQLGNWDVHYMAFGSTFLTPEITKAYGINRSAYSGVINISVLSSAKGHAAQKISISGEARNLLGQTVALKFKEVVEGSAVYYIAQIDYRNEETYNFDIKLKQGNQSQSLKFNQKFYVN